MTKIEKELFHLPAAPEAAFGRYLAFVGLDARAKRHMREDTEALLERSTSWVRRVYQHLSDFDETRAVLGWQGRLSEEQLRVRRQFFGGWLARTIGVDTSAEFARELYRTGQVHAGHGPERRHVPEDYVGLAFGLVLGFFAEVVPASRLGFWQGYLAAQQEVMRNGFHSALVLGAGSLEVDLEALGLAYEALPERLGVHLETGLLCEAVEKALVYLPALREVGLEPVPSTHEQGHWMEADTLWTFRPGWTLLVNGRDAAYLQGLSTPLSPGDTVTVLPPGR